MMGLIGVRILLGCHERAVVAHYCAKKKVDVLRLKQGVQRIHCCIQGIGESPAMDWDQQVETVAFHFKRVELILRLSL